MFRPTILVAAVAALSGCSSQEQPPADAPVADSSSQLDPPSGPASAQDSVTAEQIDGVWIFHHAPDAAMQALHGGVPTIEGGCLLVDGAVVVWHESRLDEAKAALSAAQNGDATVLSIPGGGMSLNEGADIDSFPPPVREHCETDTVWFEGPK